MASSRYYFCKKCQQQSSTPKLLDTLRDFSKSGSAPKCNTCGQEQELHVVLPFGLSAGTTDCNVLSVFLPGELVSWEHKGETVTFYPFLVVLQRVGADSYSAWLPYWHLHGNKRKYGQYPPFLDDPQFIDLVRQAQQRGYWKD